MEVVNEPSIDIIIELIGGLYPAKELVELAIKNGKHVVTANRNLIASKGSELMELANKYKVSFEFEGAVGCGIPIINSLRYLKTNRIKKIVAVINSTTNYILSEMSLNNLDFTDALEKAITMKFSEPDITDDIDGLDCAEKLSILTMLSKRIKLDKNDIIRVSVKGIEKIDIELFKEHNFTIKQLSLMIDENNEFCLGVSPFLLSSGNIFDGVIGRVNSIYIEGDIVGPLMFYGKGVSGGATASAIVSDLCKIKGDFYEKEFSNYGLKTHSQKNSFKSREFKFYIRCKFNSYINNEYILNMLNRVLMIKNVLMIDEGNVCFVTNKYCIEDIDNKIYEIQKICNFELKIRIPIIEDLIYNGLE
jgi:homoserine dehydrogenase